MIANLRVVHSRPLQLNHRSRRNDQVRRVRTSKPSRRTPIRLTSSRASLHRGYLTSRPSKATMLPWKSQRVSALQTNKMNLNRNYPSTRKRRPAKRAKRASLSPAIPRCRTVRVRWIGSCSRVETRLQRSARTWALHWATTRAPQV